MKFFMTFTVYANERVLAGAHGKEEEATHAVI